MKYGILLLVFFSILSCTKKSSVQPIDKPEEEPVQQTDFREKYIGIYKVHIRENWHGWDGHWGSGPSDQAEFDRLVRVHYRLEDTIEIGGPSRNRYPAIVLSTTDRSIMSYFTHYTTDDSTIRLGIKENGKMIKSEIPYQTNVGGFIQSDSINFTTKYDYKNSDLFEIIGKKLR